MLLLVSDAARPLSRSERERRVSARLHRGSAANAASAELLASRSGAQVGALFLSLQLEC